jgi:hypothetical protein
VRSLLICTPHQNYSSEKIKKNELGGSVAYLAERRVAYMVVVGKQEGNRPLGKLRVDGKMILKSNLQEV